MSLLLHLVFILKEQWCFKTLCRKRFNFIPWPSSCFHLSRCLESLGRYWTVKDHPLPTVKSKCKASICFKFVRSCSVCCSWGGEGIETVEGKKETFCCWWGTLSLPQIPASSLFSSVQFRSLSREFKHLPVSCYMVYTATPADFRGCSAATVSDETGIPKRPCIMVVFNIWMNGVFCVPRRLCHTSEAIYAWFLVKRNFPEMGV